MYDRVPIEQQLWSFLIEGLRHRQGCERDIVQPRVSNDHQSMGSQLLTDGLEQYFTKLQRHGWSLDLCSSLGAVSHPMVGSAGQCLQPLASGQRIAPESVAAEQKEEAPLISQDVTQ